ncbi:MAG: branched-chain amino acid ABC transporter substrate-binding protein [Anaerolineae bacterium]
MSTDKSVARIAIAISSRPGRAAAENPIYRGLQVAMDDLAADASLPVSLEWRVCDDFGDHAATKRFADELAADPTVVGVIGPMGSGEAFVNAPVFNAAGLAQVSPCASHPDLCRRGYQTFFRLVANENVQGGELARLARGYLNAQRAAIVHANDLWAQTVADLFTREYESLGGQVVSRQEYAPTDRDFNGLIRATVVAEPELVFCAVHPVEGPTISGGLRLAGLRVPFLGTDAMKTAFPLGGGEPDGEAYHTHSGADFRRLPSAAQFRQAYAARFPEDSTYSPEAYDSAMLLAEAIRRAGRPDRAAVLAALRDLGAYDGVTGRIRFDASGERLDAPISFYQVRLTAGGREMHYLGMTSELLPASAAL